MTVSMVTTFAVLAGLGAGFVLDHWVQGYILHWAPLLAESEDCGTTPSLVLSWRSRYFDLLPLACGLSSGLLAIAAGPHRLLIWELLLWWGLLALISIDLELLLLPDSLTQPLLWVGLILNALGEGPTTLNAGLWGAVGGYALLWVMHQIHFRWTGRTGLGQGDFKLLAGLGAWLGWDQLPMLLLLSSLLGLGAGLIWLRRRQLGWQTLFPFGPFLAFAGYGVMLWG